MFASLEETLDSPPNRKPLLNDWGGLLIRSQPSRFAHGQEGIEPLLLEHQSDLEPPDLLPRCLLPPRAGTPGQRSAPAPVEAIGQTNKW